MNDEEPPYRNGIQLPLAAKQVSTTVADEQNFDSLKIARQTLADALEGLDKWHAFDSTETELKLKQQIKAHQMAYNIIAPVFEMLNQAVMTIDDKYKNIQR